MSAQHTPAFNCLLTGIGGQGTVLASRLIADAYMAQAHAVRTAETIGMSQRGGTVASHVRTAATLDGIASSLIPLMGANLIIAFEPGEAARALPYLAPGGLMVTALQAQRPVTASLAGAGNAMNGYDGSEQLAYLQERLSDNDGALIVVDGASVVEELGGNPKVLNVVLLGAAMGGGGLALAREDLADAIKARVKPQFVEGNLAALDAGIAIGKGL